MAKEKDQILDEIKNRMPDIVQTLGYMEHQIDLITKFNVDLLYLLTQTTGLVDPAQLPAGLVERLEQMEFLLESSSVDFDNLTHPMQNYKIPKAKERKDLIRQIQQRYVSLVYERGLND